MTASLGAVNRPAILFFLLFVSVTLAITYWAARRTRSTEHFYAAGRSVTGLQNGLALAGDYMTWLVLQKRTAKLETLNQLRKVKRALRGQRHRD